MTVYLKNDDSNTNNNKDSGIAAVKSREDNGEVKEKCIDFDSEFNEVVESVKEQHGKSFDKISSAQELEQELQNSDIQNLNDTNGNMDKELSGSKTSAISNNGGEIESAGEEGIKYDKEINMSRPVTIIKAVVNSQSDSQNNLVKTDRSQNFLGRQRSKKKPKVESSRHYEKAILTLSFIVISYFICWLPFGILIPADSLQETITPNFRRIDEHALIIVRWWGLCHSLLNPLCYAAAQPLMRETIWKLVRCVAW